MSDDTLAMAALEPVEVEVGPVTRTQIVRFAGAGGDFNPLHHDDAFARSAGQPGVFAMGQLTAAMLATLASDVVGLRNLRAYSVRFTARVWPGDVLRLSARETGREDVDGERRVALALEATRQDGEVAARATATGRIAG